MKRVLILEDDPCMLYMMKEALEYSNYEVETTEREEDVFKLLDSYKPDLVLLEYVMGGINGGEVCNQIKTNPLTSYIPVVIVSAYNKLLISFGNYGSDAILPKPFGLADLIETVELWTENKAFA